jgi:hypothetical protein
MTTRAGGRAGPGLLMARRYTRQEHGSVEVRTVQRSKSGPLMSALGHPRPRRSKPPGHPCPLCPESGQTAGRLAISALCHKRTYAVQQNLLMMFQRRLSCMDKIGGQRFLRSVDNPR